MSGGVSAPPIVNPPTDPAPNVNPAGNTPATKSAIYGWIEGRNEFVPISSYPSPTHFSASILEVNGPQEFVISSHPASGSTASILITNPATTNRTIIAIESMEAALAQGTASTGQANTATLFGGVGGTYDSTPLVIGTVANTADRYQSTSGHVFVSGNGVTANSTENLGSQFSVAGITSLFQYLTLWFRFGA